MSMENCPIRFSKRKSIDKHPSEANKCRYSFPCIIHFTNNHHWFRSWLVAWLAQSNYLNQSHRTTPKGHSMFSNYIMYSTIREYKLHILRAVLEQRMHVWHRCMGPFPALSVAWQ